MQQPPCRSQSHSSNVIPNLVDQAILSLLRLTALRFSQLVILFFAVHLAISITAPISAHFSNAALSDPAYGLLSFTCHQIPARCFHILGESMGICQRCASLDVGILLGGFFWTLGTSKFPSLSGRAMAVIGGICLLPIALDGTASLLGITGSSPERRVFTGLVAGLWLGTLIVTKLRSFCADAARLLD